MTSGMRADVGIGPYGNQSFYLWEIGYPTIICDDPFFWCKW